MWWVLGEGEEASPNEPLLRDITRRVFQGQLSFLEVGKNFHDHDDNYDDDYWEGEKIKAPPPVAKAQATPPSPACRKRWIKGD